MQQMNAFGEKRANAARNENQATKRHQLPQLHLFTNTFLQLPSKHHPGCHPGCHLLCRLWLLTSPKVPKVPKALMRNNNTNKNHL
jgi:hypothetical protein